MKIEFRNKTLKMVMIAMCTAIISVLSIVSIPMPAGVPVTLQTFAIALCGFLLGPKLAWIAVVLYIALGSVGLPVFAGFSSGIAVFAGYSGGFLWGFIFMAVLCGIGMQMNHKMSAVLFGLAGLAVCHICGIIQFSAVASTPLIESFFLASFPYLLKDAISVVAAYVIALAVGRGLKAARLISG